ncbi:MAG: hybrid sensor histidine kinase/response regulator [Pseudomonadota bacterium]
MATDPDLLKLLVATFTTELEEQTQVMIDSLLQLEKSPGSSKDIDTLFRAAHNIKGAARGIGINNVGDIAHQLEDIFSAVRKKELSLDASTTDLMLDAVDKIRVAMSAYLENKPLTFDIEELKKRLAKIAEMKSPAPVTPSGDAEKKEAKTLPVERDDSLKEPEVILKNAESIRVSIDNIDKVSSLMEEIQVNKISLDDQYANLDEVIMKTKHLLEFWNHNRYGSAPNTDESLAKMYQGALDETTEIHYLLTQLHQHFRGHLNELSLLSNSLHDEIRRLRLIPASHLLQTLPRFVRNLAQEMHKEVHLHIKGEDVKMDKLILEGLNDPLIHLLRNAIDHGIETPINRHKRGKSEQANINIEIVDEGNEILIIFNDDGNGIDIDKIAESALKKNLITEAELSALTNNEILQLIFRPGFSTKDIITNISGRGVGLDVVKSNLASLKGSVTVETMPNLGTTFYLRVPLTLTSERGLLVRSGDENFVMPTNSIIRVMDIQSHEMMMVETEEVVMLDQHPVVVRSLAKILNLAEANHKNKIISVIIVKRDWHTLALIVDEIIGEREIVVKPLQDPLNEMPCIAGGTLSSIGEVILVLNVGDIIYRGLNNSFETVLTTTDEITVKKQDIPHILVVDDSITTRTLEQNVLENKGYKVTVAVNGKEAWDLLQNNQFSMLITDVNMPIMDGFELTERVKKSERLSSLPVIIVTALGSDNEKRRGIEVGANAYIVKSEFESNVLLQTVSQLV